ncbi:MAG: O-antigen ligase family protein, partial [Chloroflexi bacterium]|nr:O-antigen ligase family protein [Chloroflexota bacterium]
MTRLALFAERLLEAGWLAAAIAVPLYFDVYTSRVFEPDKIILLRCIVLVMLVAQALRLAEARATGERLTSGVPRGLYLTTLALLAANLLATVTSLSPLTSLWGSYNRLQGLYTLATYVALFFTVAANLRTRAQLDRLIRVALLTSLPIAIYGIVQHFRLDPLPWGGDVTFRVSSTLGNPIFLAAYLIMVVPWTIGRLIAALSAAGRITAGALVHAAGRGARDRRLGVALGQVIVLGALVSLNQRFSNLWWTAFGIFGALVLVALLFERPGAQQAIEGEAIEAGVVSPAVPKGNERATGATGGPTSPRGPLSVKGEGERAVSGGNGRADPGPGPISVDGEGGRGDGATGAEGQALPLVATRALVDALGLSALLALQLACVVLTQSRGPQIGLIVGLIVMALLFALRRGSRRLALASVALAVVFATFLVAFNLSGSPLAPLRDVPYVGRLGRLTEWDRGTGRVRVLIWEGSLRLLRERPSAGPGLDPLAGVRPLIGYGPEAMNLAFNKVYPPELGQLEARNAAPDRNHNGLLDALLMTGVVGLVAYLVLLVGIGRLAWERIQAAKTLAHQGLVVGIAGGLVAHVVETQFGIAIAATYSYLWLSVGILVAIGHLAVRSPATVAAGAAATAPTGRRGGGATGGRGAGVEAGTRGYANAASPDRVAVSPRRPSKGEKGKRGNRSFAFSPFPLFPSSPHGGRRPVAPSPRPPVPASTPDPRRWTAPE